MRFTQGNKIKYTTAIAAALALTITTQGCATKFYGRQDDMTSHDKESMVCEQIELEVARTRAFIDQVNQKSAFSALDVVAILIDFGIGNHLEKYSALESANKKIAALDNLRNTKQCETALL